MIRLTRKRVIVTAVVLFLLTGGLLITWEACDWPPVRLILKYGFPPTGGPTGRRTTAGGIEFVELSPGYFRMGSHRNCMRGDFWGEVGERIGVSLGGRPPLHRSNECPPRWVSIEKPFWIAVTEVTNEQYAAFDAEHVSALPSGRGDFPALYVTWNRARQFCEWVSRVHHVQARLPTEAEWEYACRAGTKGQRFFSSEEASLGEYSWYRANSARKPHAVRRLMANRWGLFDVYGNAAEWCEDPAENGVTIPRLGQPRRRPDGEERPRDVSHIERGGNYLSRDHHIGSAYRGMFCTPDWQKFRLVGIRPVLTRTNSGD